MTASSIVRANLAPRPFLKWAGGKSQLLRQLRERVPEGFGRYFEPFLGGGALFFDTLPKRAVLSDVNQEIIDCYTAVRDDVHGLIEALGAHRYDVDHYYAVRDTDPKSLSLVERAARTIFLNKTGFNGLYRVNRSGKFNVPFGRYAKPSFCDPGNLLACSAALSNADLKAQDFETTTAKARASDFVYFDPPYVPLSRTSAFTAYAPGGFDQGAQERLAGVFGALAKRGVTLLLSNSDVPSIRELYASYDFVSIDATRVINCKATRRGPVRELLVHHVASKAAPRPRAKATKPTSAKRVRA